MDLRLLENIPHEQKQLLSRTCKINLARKSFYFFCKTLFPNIYDSEHAYLRKVCDDLQKIFENKIIKKETGRPAKFLHLNIPPRFYKSFTIGLFAAWVLGLDPKNQVVIACYSMPLALILSRNIRNHISQKAKKGGQIVYNEIFPKTYLKKGHTAVGEWALAGSHLSFKATSFSGSLTGFGSNSLFIIDDQINLAKDASNEILLAENWEWFRNTMWSRLEKGAKLIVNMTRWSDNDFCGNMLKVPEMARMTHVIKYPVINRNTGEMLCDAVMDAEGFALCQVVVDPSILSANYYQVPINSEGRLYKSIKTYSKDTVKFDLNSSNLDIRAYFDPCGSKGGGDYFSGIAYIVHDKQAYQIDIFYENDAKKITDECICKFLITNRVKKYKIETNKNENIGKEIQGCLKEKFQIQDIQMEEIYSTGNKQDRIFYSAHWVQGNVYFQENWDKIYPKPYESLISYQHPGKNKNDDFEDCLAGLKNDVCNFSQVIKQIYGKKVQFKQFSKEEEYCFGY